MQRCCYFILSKEWLDSVEITGPNGRGMKFIKRRFAAAPEGTAVLFFIQIFATLGFAVLYSTLVRFLPKPNRRLTLPLVHLFCSLDFGLPQSGVIP